MRGLRKFLTPFAPDQSGAESVLYELGGIVVILDAGGCAGNICGFDEPRWSATKSAVFSAGLRDMDAVMGRDRLLVKKICDCVTKIDAKFVAIIGTPVPAVIGTDLQAVKRMLEKKIDLPVITVPTDGMHLYDRGVSLAYQALLRDMYLRGSLEKGPGESREIPHEEQPGEGREIPHEEQPGSRPGRVGVFGVTPLDLPELSTADVIREALKKEGFRNVVLYGSGATLEDYERAGENTLNIAASPDGIVAVKFLQERFGTPCEIRFPGAEMLLRKITEVQASHFDRKGRSGQAGHSDRADCASHPCRRVLIVHSQILGNSLRDIILRENPQAQVTVASWFGMDQKTSGGGDRHLKEEDDFIELVRDMQPDLIIGDRVMERMIPEYQGKFLHLPQFAVSGQNPTH